MCVYVVLEMLTINYDKMDYHQNWIISAYSIITVRLFKRMLNCRFFVQIEALFLSNSPS